MATDIVQLKADGVGVYVKTHVSAVEGLSSTQGPKGDQGIQGPKGDPGIQGSKGDTGATGTNATTTAIATQTVNGLMSAADKKKLDNTPNIIFTKVGIV